MWQEKKRRWMKEGSKNITSIRKHAKKNNWWGWICKGGRLSLKLFTNNIDYEFYVNILEEKCLEINYQEYKINRILQFDNYPKHKSKLAMEFIKKKKDKNFRLFSLLSRFFINWTYLVHHVKRNEAKRYQESIRINRWSRKVWNEVDQEKNRQRYWFNVL